MKFLECGKLVSEGYKNLSAQEREHYQDMCDQENKTRYAEYQANQESLPLDAQSNHSGSMKKQEKSPEDKKPMTAFMFYMQVDPEKMPALTEISKIVGNEWKQLDAFKRKQFEIPPEVQTDMRKKGHLNDITHLRNAVL